MKKIILLALLLSACASTPKQCPQVPVKPDINMATMEQLQAYATAKLIYLRDAENECI
jgi:starvation-inducible outer membrane lipoprotein